jgi:hypothetical protein
MKRSIALVAGSMFVWGTALPAACLAAVGPKAKFALQGRAQASTPKKGTSGLVKQRGQATTAKLVPAPRDMHPDDAYLYANPSLPRLANGRVDENDRRVIDARIAHQRAKDAAQMAQARAAGGGVLRLPVSFGPPTIPSPVESAGQVASMRRMPLPLYGFGARTGPDRATVFEVNGKVPVFAVPPLLSANPFFNLGMAMLGMPRL